MRDVPAIDGIGSLWFHERAKAVDFNPLRHSIPSYFQLKLDGVGVTLFKQLDGRTVAFSRDVRPHLEMSAVTRHFPVDEAFSLHAPPRSSVRCELWAPGHPASEVKRFVAEEQWGDLRLTAWSIPWWDGQEAPALWGWYEEKMRMMTGSYKGWGYLNALRVGDATTAQVVEYAMGQGAEGAMLKRDQLDPGYKLKPRLTVDCVVTGFKWGRGEFDKLVGALLVGVWEDDGEGGTIKEVASCSGMTMDERVKMTEQRDSLVGRVCEVEYQYVGSGGRLRHPGFVRWRDDKPADQCTMEQLR